jgi:tryptophanyl-tRNA synthetase
LSESGKPLRVLSGIQPTADSFHLGNWLGALRQWVHLQDTHDAFYCIVDQHAITGTYDPALLAKRTLTSFAQLLALGVDPTKATIFVQSHVPEHSQLQWVLSCLTGFGEASRMTQFKDKSLRDGADRATVGLFTYPVLQAADILIYLADLVPVGEDQRQHLELTRDLAQRFNSTYGETLVPPRTLTLGEGAKVLDLSEPAAKMSKSVPSGCVFLLDDPSVVRKKFMSAVTDSGSGIEFDVSNKPGVSNLLTILSAVSGQSVETWVGEFEGKGYGDLKGTVADAVIANVTEPTSKKMTELMSDETELERLIADGAIKARGVAGPTLQSVYEKVGFLPPTPLR